MEVSQCSGPVDPRPQQGDTVLRGQVPECLAPFCSLEPCPGVVGEGVRVARVLSKVRPAPPPTGGSGQGGRE